MDKSDDAPLSRSEFVKILLSTPSNCELRCQVLKVFQTFRDAKCTFNVTPLRCTQNVTRYFSIYIYLYLFVFVFILINVDLLMGLLPRFAPAASILFVFWLVRCIVWVCYDFFLLSLVPMQFALSELLEEAWNRARIFVTGGLTSEITEDDRERGCHFLHFPSS